MGSGRGETGAAGSSKEAAAARIQAGQAVYTPSVLALYDLLVLGISSHLVWRCPAADIRRLYARNLSINHLDVGVGSGYFLDHADFPGPNPRVGLMDLNPHSLEHTARRIRRYLPECYRHNVLAPLELQAGTSAPPAVQPFDSLAMNYLLHCLPGTMEDKAGAFDHLIPVLKPGARVFGSTILHGGVPRSLPARALMALYNRRGIFSNQGDDLDGLHRALERRFDGVEIETRGCVALFSARMHA
ncbi:MAG: class I SAM-dependent methyltransferase [Gammaproteobacteria bacterium]